MKLLLKKIKFYSKPITAKNSNYRTQMMRTSKGKSKILDRLVRL